MRAKRPSERPFGRKDAPGSEAAREMANELRAAFGANLRMARTEAGLSQQDVESLTGIMQHYVSLIENGRRSPTLDTMAALAVAVGKDVRALLKPPRSDRLPKK